MPEQDAGFVATLVEFARELRAEEVPAGPGDVLTYCAAVAELEPSDLLDVYWAGRSTLVSRREQIPVYNRVFRRYFLGYDEDPGPKRPFSVRTRAEAKAVLQVPETEPGTGEQQEEREAELGLVASDAAALKGKAFRACSADELAALRRIMRTIRLAPPRRRSRRSVADPKGRRPDLRRTVRETLRTLGDPPRLPRRARRLRPRPLILLLDVSGSMADYSRNLLQFAYSTGRAADRVEVFCFGTRLTRITRELRHRKPDEALDRAAGAVADWDGGTRIGESLHTFVRTWARRGLSRGGIVVICSDGLDRGDPAVLAEAMARLSRLSHRIVWLNPHKPGGRDDGFRPNTLGMMVAEPYVDRLLSAQDLRSLEEFAAVLPGLR
ncbi:VWA domain-containing protein [Amycolatopsis sp. SID8362]|uniref:vWA domain-containing protein n=1 Tax=Amycolatopsis sp. SID8362 TaxID=2690346 RepID=UPI00136E7B22|nr:VWA domain-containing protein [Amycolatopsis sp. SID8362]NBH04281.1 VWA domain-containing protein [Amycolatopsis sp. SID8362]NED40980.1 VWA domain-containing protein [Amycolatopsis sp. SID8362]